MNESTERHVIDFEPALHAALRTMAEQTGRSLSDLVNEAVRLVLIEDAEDLAAIEERAGDAEIGYDEFLEMLRADGKI